MALALLTIILMTGIAASPSGINDAMQIISSTVMSSLSTAPITVSRFSAEIARHTTVADKAYLTLTIVKSDGPFAADGTLYDNFELTFAEGLDVALFGACACTESTLSDPAWALSPAALVTTAFPVVDPEARTVTVSTSGRQEVDSLFLSCELNGAAFASVNSAVSARYTGPSGAELSLALAGDGPAVPVRFSAITLGRSANKRAHMPRMILAWNIVLPPGVTPESFTPTQLAAMGDAVTGAARALGAVVSITPSKLGTLGRLHAVLALPGVLAVEALAELLEARRDVFFTALDASLAAASGVDGLQCVVAMTYTTLFGSSEGQYLCRSTATKVLGECELAPTLQCGDRFQGTADCYAIARETSRAYFSCDLAVLPTPVPQHDCPPILPAVATFNGDFGRLTISYSVNAATDVESVGFYISLPSQGTKLAFPAGSTACSGASQCIVEETAPGVVRVKILKLATAPDRSFVLRVDGNTWFDFAYVTVSSIAVLVSGETVAYPDAMTVAVAANNVNNVAALTRAFFVPDSTVNPFFGTLLVAVPSSQPDQPIDSSQDQDLGSALLTLPEGWTLGSSCDIYRAGPTANRLPSQLLPLRRTITDGARFEWPSGSYRFLREIGALYIKCSGVSAVDFDEQGGDISVDFERLFKRATYRATFTYRYSSFDYASDAPLYSGFDAIVDSGRAFSAATLATWVPGIFTASAASFVVPDSFSYIRRVTIAFMGSDRVWHNLYSMQADIDQYLTSQTGLVRTGAVETGIGGVWRCGASPSTYAPCAVTPAGCGSSFTSDPVCVAPGGEPVTSHTCAAAIAGLLPVPAPQSNSCVPRVTELDAQYDTAAQMLTVSYTIDETQFLGRPTIVFTLTTASPASLLLLIDAGCEAPCPYSLQLPDTVYVLNVAKSGSVRLPARARFFAPAATLSVGVTLYPVAGSILAVGAKSTFDLPADMGSYTLPITPRVSFSPTTKASRQGTLIVGLDTSSSNFLLPTRTETFNKIVLTLPNLWRLGSTCRLRTVGSGESTWLLALSASSLQVSHPEGNTVATLTYSGSASVDRVRGFFIECDNISAPEYESPVSGPVDVVIHGTANAYRVHFLPGEELVYDHANASDTSGYVGWSMFVPTSTTPFNSAEVDAIVTRSIFGYVFDARRAGNTIHIAIVASQHNRAYLHFLKDQYAISTLVSVLLAGRSLTFDPTTPETGQLGSFKCAVGPDLGPCLSTPTGCSSIFKTNAPICIQSGLYSAYACPVSVVPAAIPARDFENCVNVVSASEHSYDAETEAFNLTLSFRSSSFGGNPTMVVAIRSSPSNLFDWARAPALCSEGVTCTLDRPNSRVLVKFVVAPGKRSFTLACPPAYWLRDAQILFEATMEEDRTPASVVAVGVPKVFDLGSHVGVYSFSANMYASFAFGSDSTQPHVGTFFLTVESSDGLALTQRGEFRTILVTSPSEWDFGAFCHLYVRNVGDGMWLPSRHQSSIVYNAGTTTFNAPGGLKLDEIAALYFVCPFATLGSPAPVLAADLTLGFNGLSNLFLTEVTASLSVDVVSASDTRLYYVGFKAAVGAGLDNFSESVSRIVGGQAVFAAAVERSAPGEVTCVLAFRASERALTLFLAQEAQINSLLADTLSTSEFPWTLVARSLETGPSGAWRCLDGTDVECALTPPGCSNSFQSEPVCWRDGAAHPYACHSSLAVLDKPRVTPDYTSCEPSVTGFAASYDHAARVLTVDYTVAEAEFLGSPSVRFTISTLQSDILSLSSPTCSSNGACSYAPLPSGGISVVVNTVATHGSIQLAATVQKWARSGSVVLDATDVIEFTSIVAVGVSKALDVLTNVGIYDTPAPAVFFSPESATSHVGTLIVALDNEGVTLAPAGVAGPITTARLALPTGWSLGTCTVRHGAASGPAWLFANALVGSSQTTSEGVVTLSAGPNANAVTNMFVVCSDVSPPDVSAAGDTLKLLIEGGSGAYLIESSTTPLDFTSSSATSTDQYIGFTLTLDTAVDVHVASYREAVFPGALTGLDLSWSVTDAAVDVTIQLTGAGRAFSSLLSTSAAISSLSADVLSRISGAPIWSFAVGSAVEAGNAGVWLCKDAEADAGYSTCLEAPAGCTDSYQGEITCITEAGAPSLYACAFVEPLRPPVADYSVCAGIVTSLDARVSDDLVTVTYALNVSAFVGNPKLVFTVRTIAENIFDWARPNCPADVACRYEASALSAKFASRRASGELTIASPVLHWAKSGSIEINAAVEGHAGTSILSDIDSSFPLLAPLAVYNISAATVVAAYASGTLIVAATQAMLFAPETRPVRSILLSIPPAWHMGSQCTVRATTAAGPHWPFAVPVISGVTVEGGVIRISSSSLLLSQTRGIYVICTGVTPASSGPVTLGFEGASGLFLAEITAAATVSVDASSALDQAAYAGFALDLDSTVDVTASAFATAVGGNAVDVAARRSAEHVLVTIRLSGGLRAYSAFVANEVSVGVLATSVLNGATFVSGSLETGTEGSWLCFGDDGGLAPCVETPEGCTDRFQSPVTCVSGAELESDYACAFLQAHREPVTTYAGCRSLMSVLGASFNGSAVDVTFSLDDAAVAGNPGFVFAVWTESSDIFDWSAPNCTHGLTCTFDSDSHVVFARFARLAAIGRLSLATTVARWAKSGAFHVAVTMQGHTQSVLVGDDVASFPLPGPLAVHSVDAAVKAVFAFGERDSAPEGTLVVSVFSATAFAPEPRDVRSLFMDLPGGWSLGDTCIVRAVHDAAAHWLLSVPELSSVTVQDGTILLPPGLTLSSTLGLYIVCEGVVAAASGGTISLSFEGEASAFLAEVSETPTITLEARSDSVSYIGFTIALDDTVDVSSPSFNTAVGAGIVEVVARRTASNVKTTIGLSGGSRAFATFLANSTALAALAAGSVLQGAYVDDSLESGVQGAWLCESASLPLYSDCITTPPECGNSFQGPMVCVVSTTAPSDYACVLSTMPPVPLLVPNYDSCAPRITSFDVEYSSSPSESVAVSFTVNSDDQFIGGPALVFSLTVSVQGLFDWSNATCASCVFSGNTLFINVEEVFRASVFTIPSAAVRWAEKATVTVGVTLRGSETSVAVAGIQTVFDLPDKLNVVTISPAVNAVFASGGSQAPHQGTLIVCLDAKDAALAVDARRVGVIFLELPSGWTLGSQCSISVRNSSSSAWLPSLTPVTSDGIDGNGISFFAAALVLTDAREVTIVCTGVTPDAAPTAGGNIAVRFEGASREFLVDVEPGAHVSFNPTTADALAYYVRFQLRSDSAEDRNLEELAGTIMGSGLARDLSRASYQAADVITIYIGVSGVDRALLYFLSDESDIRSLAESVLPASTAGAGTWALVSGSVLMGPQGSWRCNTGTAEAPGYQDCLTTPAGCGDSFQGPVVCVAQGDVSEHACGLFEVPRAELETDQCVPTLTNLDAIYDRAADTISVSFTADASTLLGKPTLLLTMSTNVSGMFNWTEESCSGVACAYDSSRSTLTVTLPGVSASGSFIVASRAVRWAKASVLSVQALLEEAEGTLLLSQTVELPAHFVSALPSSSVTASYAAADEDETRTTGKLVISVDAGRTKAVGPGDAPLSTIIISLPPAWVLGESCLVFSRRAAETRWAPLLSGLAASVSGGELFITTDRFASETESLYIVCDEVASPAAGEAIVSVAIEGVDMAYLIEAAPASVAYSAVSVVPAYVGFQLTTVESTELVLETLVRGTGFLESAPINVTGSSDAALIVTISLWAGDRAFSATLADELALHSLARGLGDGWAYVSGSLETGTLGRWLCGTTETGFASCTIAHSCGDAYAGPVTCTNSDQVSSSTSPHVCALDTRPPAVVRTGCGLWMCKTAAGEFVACSDARVCSHGCSENVAITTERIASDAGFESFCVVDGSAVDGSVFCPLSLVDAPDYAPSGVCNAVTSCKLSCSNANGIAKHCDSDLSWSECIIDAHNCGNGRQFRHTYCSSETFAIGTDTSKQAHVVSASLCDGTAPDFDLQKSCSGAYCIEYAWQCDDGQGGLVDCEESDRNDINTGYLGCEGVCGFTTQTRHVHCVSFIEGRTVKSTTTSELLCLARAPKPQSSKPCISSTCASTEWRCSSTGSNPALGTTEECTDDSTFMCPLTGCSAAKEHRQDVACVDVLTGARIADEHCSLDAKPALTKLCPAVDTSCTVDFHGAPCSLTAGGQLHTSPATCTSETGESSGTFQRGVCTNALGELRTGACSLSSLLRECAVPVCGDNASFEWASEISGDCISGCTSYKPQTSRCLATTNGSGPIPVDSSFCGPAPLGYAKCDDTPCGHDGICLPDAVYIDGQFNYDIAGTCACSVGYGGALCAVNATFASFEVHPLEETLSWSFDSDVASFLSLVTVHVTHTDSSITSLLAVAPALLPTAAAPSADAASFAVGRVGSASVGFAHLPHGDYIAKISGDGVFERFAEFSVTGACASDLPGTACVHGTCNAATGICECKGDYSGSTCAIPPCATMKCHKLASWCDITIADEAVCVCRPGFGGALCDKLASADCGATEPLCEHGGSRYIHEQFSVSDGSTAIVSKCGGCHCTAYWTGPSCARCGLACPNGALPNSDCTACSCKPGYHGDQCDQRHGVFTLNFHKNRKLAWYALAPAHDEQLSVWKTELESTVNALIQLTAPSTHARAVLFSHRRVNDTRGSEFVQVKLRVGAFESAATSPESWNTYEALRQLRALFTRSVGVRVTSPVFKHPFFSPLYLDRGVGMKDPNCRSEASGVCPSGTLYEAEIDEWKPDAAQGGDSESGNASKGTDTTSIAIGVGVGVGSLLLLAGALYYLKRSGRICGSTSSKSPEAAEPAEYQGELATV